MLRRQGVEHLEIDLTQVGKRLARGFGFAVKLDIDLLPREGRRRKTCTTFPTPDFPAVEAAIEMVNYFMVVAASISLCTRDLAMFLHRDIRIRYRSSFAHTAEI